MSHEPEKAFCFGDPNMVRKPHKNDWTAAERAQLRQSVMQGVAMREIAKRLGRSYRAVETKARRMGFHPRVQQNWSDSEIAYLRKCARANKTLAEAASEIGRTLNAARLKAQSLGITFAKAGESHHRAKLTKEQIAEIFALRRQGKTACEIAKGYEVSESQIFRILDLENRYVDSLPMLLDRDCNIEGFN